MIDQTLQVCFILDCTASMQPWIDAAKQKIVETLETIRQQHPDYIIYAAFVGYRDFNDKEQFIRIGFTEAIHDLKNLIMDINADGGDDQCENVAGAYKMVAELEWHANVRCVFHITDAPNHGIEYHEDYVEDDYPNGHQYINLKSEVRYLADRNIDLTVFSINASTNKMYRIMEKIYDDVHPNMFSIVNLKNRRYNPQDVFYSEVSQRITTSIHTRLR